MWLCSDNCLHPKEKIEAKEPLLIVLQAVKALGGNFRQEYIIDFVKGRGTDDIKDHKHNLLEEFGLGEKEDPKIWNPVIRQAMLDGYLKERCRKLWFIAPHCSRKSNS